MPPATFLNYRRDDAGASARLLYDRLTTAFGVANVFLDVRNNQPGLRWLDEIKRAAGRGVFLALIGERWLTQLRERERERADDYVRLEIEYALKRSSAVSVIPVLLGDALPPMTEHLPRSLWPLAEIQVERIRDECLDEDIARLIARIHEIAAQPAPALVVVQRTLPDLAVTERPEVARAPDAAHFETVLRHMQEGTVVPVLGPGINSAAGRWTEGCGSPPNAHDLAATLAARVGLESVDLAEVAQYVSTTQGEPDLFKSLKRILSSDYSPQPVHRFLASVPQWLAERGAPRSRQMIVTTNYDTALEQAFDDVQEPYDLAVYMASGDDRGKFVHLPYERGAETILRPNSYGDLPIDEDGELERTLIVKIHGAVDGGVGDYRWKENYVVTEDHYIDYLSRNSVENLVPVQILDALMTSHCLFLGYTMHDWHLRVFLHRIWRGRQLAAKSWAVQRDPDVLDKEFWGRGNVDLFNAALGEYVAQFANRQPAQA